jgi:hypothetical protein
MTEGHTRVWMPMAAAFGAVFVLLNLVNLVFIDGDRARDIVAMSLGGLVVAVALARYRGWRGLGR